MTTPFYDYIIVGHGMAGLKLALAFSKDTFFKDKRIALIDHATQNTNDKTWCFWDKTSKDWEAIIYRQWQETHFASSNFEINIPLDTYSYYMIRSIDFYKYCKKELQAYPNFHFIKDTVLTIKEGSTHCSIKTKLNTYTSSHVFDSRIPQDYYKTNSKYVKIYQHFKGWVIETTTPTFNTTTFTVMDYRVQYKNATAFTYVLPLSKTSALVEYTFFTPFTIEREDYDTYLENYITTILNIPAFTIKEIEEGIIPMTGFPFHKFNTKRITKIGTAGGWVKPSSGYAFKLTDIKIKQLISNIKADIPPSRSLISKKYSFYDKIFLRVLHDENDKGEWIFKQFYSKNTPRTMFSFLDETSTLSQDFKVITSLLSWSFIKGLYKSLVH